MAVYLISGDEILIGLELSSLVDRLVGDAEQPVERGTIDIDIDEHRLPVHLRHHDGQIGGKDRGLAHPAVRDVWDLARLQMNSAAGA